MWLILTKEPLLVLYQVFINKEPAELMSSAGVGVLVNLVEFCFLSLIVRGFGCVLGGNHGNIWQYVSF